MTWTEIASSEELSALVGEPIQRVREKVRPLLGQIHRDWLAASPFCVVGTADAAGNCDVSPKGDPPGDLVHVIDDHRIAIAERPGNRRVDGYKNIVSNPHVGINFFIPGRGDTLRVNGGARLLSDAPFFEELTVRGQRPILVLLVDIDEVFFHCAKAFLRSGLWDPQSWAPGVVPRRAVIAREHEDTGMTLEQLDEYYGEAYAKGLY